MFLVLISTLAAAAPGFASGDAQDDRAGVELNDRAKAKELTQRAKTSFAAGRFAEAADLFEQAHTLLPAPGLLLNIAQCHRRLKRPVEARSYLERFLEAAPGTPLRPQVEDLIGRIAMAPPALHGEAIATARPLDSQTPIYDEWWFWAVVGVVVAGAAGTAVAVASDDDPGAPSLGIIDARPREDR